MIKSSSRLKDHSLAVWLDEWQKNKKSEGSLKGERMSVIKIEQLTKDYGHQRGVFDISFQVEKGEVYGFLGPNGSGKTTTIRHIMGFSRPQKGNAYINQMNCWEMASTIHQHLGYLPGEFSFPESLTGIQFINMMKALRGLKDMTRTNDLIEKFELETAVSVKRMSLGMKRKLAIVAAFMHDPDILILDEPTSGLDPIMQNVFIEFIKAEKKRGKTILLSSHIFSEIDATCDKISIIKEGRLVSTFVADELRHNESKQFEIEFNSINGFDQFNATVKADNKLAIIDAQPQKKQVRIQVNDADVNYFMNVLSDYDLKFISEIKFTLEDYFMKFYDQNRKIEKGAK